MAVDVGIPVHYIWLMAAAFATTLLLTPLAKRLAIRFDAVDYPSKRRINKRPIPRLGGLAVFAGLAVACILQVAGTILWDWPSALVPHPSMAINYPMLAISFLMIVITGTVDDIVSLSPKMKLAGQLLAACVAAASGLLIHVIVNPFSTGAEIQLGWLAYPITVIYLVAYTNIINLIDGLDGLAAGVSTIASITIFLVALQQGIILVAVLTAALAGAAFGFLYYNFNPAKIFMGDSGSQFLGFMLAGISVIGAVKSAATIALIVPILALGLPILDTTFAIVRRYRGGVPIFKPDKGHLHHRLLDLGFSQRQAVLLMYVISALLGLSAVALTEVSTQIAIAIVCVVVAVVLFGAKKLGIFHMKDSAHQH